MKQPTTTFARRYLPWAVSILAITTVLILIFDVYGATEIGNFIYNWQGLITGMFAVAAATATVLVMVFTDRAQQERHDHLASLSVKPDRLKLQRVALTTVTQLEVVYEHLVELVAPTEDMAVRPAEFIHKLDNEFSKLISLIKSPEIDDAGSLFEPVLYSYYGELKKECDSLQSARDNFDYLIEVAADRFGEYVSWAGDGKPRDTGYAISEAKRVLSDMRTQLYLFTRGLRELAKSYDRYNRF